ncbi:bacterial alpha-L-rhamnosidase-domain-containing protein [Diaporthe sp. PMI_573]|nr:bacterial alpha-L-rhamnosidase-domain-containing protein [Diaporthaceae sp. PMI_573]
MTLIDLSVKPRSHNPVQPVDIRFEHHPNGLGIGTDKPRLSWRLSASNLPHNWIQKSYQVQTRRHTGKTTGPKLNVQTCRVPSDNSVLNEWPGQPLQSRETVSVRVLASGHSLPDDPGPVANPDLSVWSEWQDVEAGLLRVSDWKAKFVTSTDPPPKDGVPHRPTLYRKEFTLEPKSKHTRARLYISALGLYAASINGRRVGDLHMAPGWTSYHHRLQYQVFDVTDLLHDGKNVIGVEVAEGWYAGRLIWVPGLRNLYGDKPGFIAQLETQDDSGCYDHAAQVVSDDSWVYHPSPRQSASIYDGEVYDARQELSGWASPEFDAAGSWDKTRILEVDLEKVRLFSPDVPPVRVTQTVGVVDIFKSPSGKLLVDFGQNLVGRVRIQGLQKPKGHELQIKHAEVLENGELGTRPLRDAKATDKYIFSGDERAKTSWSPEFTFHGFRYIELTGVSAEEVSKDNLSALVLHSDMRRTGHFSCSNELITKLHENVVWGMRGNFLSVPTDCPQRDERLGWTGDIQVFSTTASFIYDCAGLLANWLRDLSADQETNGGVVPCVIPDVLRGYSGQDSTPEAVWDDAAVLVPWNVYNWSGDAEVLRRQWPSMRTHVDRSIRRGPDGLWDEDNFQFGDWLDPNAPTEQADFARTDGTMVADAYLVHITEVMADIAVVLGDAESAARYRGEYEVLKRKYQDKYVSPAGLVVGDAQTALALSIRFGLLDRSDPAKHAVAGRRLARLTRKGGQLVATGFAGTPVVLHALAESGSLDLAYGMLQQKTCPSFLYPVTMGATTIWERWDSMLPDGSINPGSMTSFNHYALGSVANFLHSVVGGISPLQAGWGTFLVRPRPGGELRHAEVSYDGPRGRVSVRWEVGEAEEVEEEVEEQDETTQEDGARGQSATRAFQLRVEVPPNSRALVVLPGQGEGDGEWVGSGIHERAGLIPA